MKSQLARFYYDQALDLALTDQLSLAKEKLDACLSLNPQLWQGWNLLGLCCYRLGDFPQCKEAWTRSIELTPENPAEVYLTSLSSLSQVLADYHTALGHALDGNYRRALRIMEAKSFPSYEIVRFANLLGLCQFAVGEKNAAFVSWGKSLRLDKTNPWALHYIREAALNPIPERIWAKIWRAVKSVSQRKAPALWTRLSEKAVKESKC